MIEYPKVTRRIPACFAQKIELDARRQEFRDARIVDLREYRLFRGEMLVARDRCQDHIKRQRGGTGGAMG